MTTRQAIAGELDRQENGQGDEQMSRRPLFDPSVDLTQPALGEGAVSRRSLRLKLFAFA